MQTSFSQTHPEAWELFKFLTFLQTVTFGLGVFAPMMTLHKGFWIFTEASSYSILAGIEDLHAGGNTWLALLILVFSVVFPCVKIILLSWAWLTKRHSHSRRIVTCVSVLGKWSMLDVFVVALLVCAVKVNGVVSMEVRWGLHCFCLSVLLGLGVSWLTTQVFSRIIT